ncbi:copper homeostasis periplasmic binding protein CopC [Paraburkholderia bonniea]|uniref:copper homeostasis periplasmic binding protein CopC n=1 Tax=Paraburkholderia bonniea TaxID=2152891 RepID=UPI001291C83D|nr:copper homeostasis periplasmic binding protein CopC [Paraburkholderia bonniea]WJF90745.1 copper homeostasis periplasmic binding protein CopC [Paraburkholderia bonniea]WJF94059.1 copper homeostasis periplasmic binding protein CopC [Paraburkholderia bonniea]
MKPFNFSCPSRFALAVGAALCVVTSVALAHAKPLVRDPAPDAEVSAPSQVTIQFSEPLEAAFSKITLSDATGKAAATGASHIDAADKKTLHLALQPLAPGRYTVRWIAVAVDGHRTQGDYGFIVK